MTTPRVGIHLIYGSNPEPFLEAALRSVEWVDYVCAVNTAPEDGIASQNEAIVRRVVPRSKLRHDRVHMPLGSFDFAKARNACLDLANDGDYIFILDSDDVHYPEFEDMVRQAIGAGHDIITAHFWHLIGYKDRWGQEPHREILFTKTPETRFTKAVHEGLEHPRSRPYLVPSYHYCHYGYIKSPREIFKRWVLYSKIEGDPDHYAGRNPDDALAGWLDNTQPFIREHPPAVQGLLESYPCAPRLARSLSGTLCNVGLVLLTWNDADNLKECLRTLKLTRQPFKLCVVDNGSDDETQPLLDRLHDDSESGEWPCGPVQLHLCPGFHLSEALDWGFDKFMADDEIDYIGWIHPDMVFERDTWLECLRDCLDTHPDIVKVGCAELGTPIPEEPIPGNTQCYLIRKSALQEVGLFDVRFQACGGYEDWDHNRRLLRVGKVVIWPEALVRHSAMGTRSKHDNQAAALSNANLYHSIWGTWDPAV